jgi:hypothetical protein
VGDGDRATAPSRLQALTLFEWLCTAHPGRFQPGQLRTLQRRVREWRGQHGPDQDVVFDQTAVPGREAAVDFTDATDLGVTIAGQPFAYLWFAWVLSFSGWTYPELAPSESFEALVSGLQGALWTLGAAPRVVRHDSLSAATHELRRSGGRHLNARFRAVLDHYGLQSSRTKPGQPHENGVAEQSHHRTKTSVDQALLLRGHRDFVDETAYVTFVRDVIERKRNVPALPRLTEERRHLRPLPCSAIPSYTTFTCQVRRWSTIHIGGRTYSVPSRLIGHTLEVRQHPAVVEVRYRDQLVERMPRLRGREHHIDYRHIIGALVRKPGAFARYRYREELFPTLTFRRAYDALVTTHGERADIEYLRILQLAATSGQTRVATTLERVLRDQQPVRLRCHPSRRHATDADDSAAGPASPGTWPCTTPFSLEAPDDRGSDHRSRDDAPHRVWLDRRGAGVGPPLCAGRPAGRLARRARAPRSRSRRTSPTPHCALPSSRALAAWETFDTLDASRLLHTLVQQLRELATGACLETATNVLAFGLPGVGKSHALCAVAHALVDAGHRVLFMPAYALVQELLAAKRALELPRVLRKLDLFEVILVDDLGYVQQSPRKPKSSSHSWRNATSAGP